MRQQRRHRSKLGNPGGLVPASSVPRGFEVEDQQCAFSSLVGARGWLHFLSQRYVCDECLTDPWKDRGKAGKDVAERIEQLNEIEREREEGLYIY
jgi:hypothetical protein